jgi:hypothetical protein
MRNDENWLAVGRRFGHPMAANPVAAQEKYDPRVSDREIKVGTSCPIARRPRPYAEIGMTEGAYLSYNDITTDIAHLSGGASA